MLFNLFIYLFIVFVFFDFVICDAAMLRFFGICFNHPIRFGGYNYGKDDR